MEVVKEPGDADVKDAPSSSTSKDLCKSLPEDAFNNFLQGKRHMLVQDYTFAVQSLALACEMYVKHFGELAIECGEVYFLYGKALFRLSQQQAGILGEALNDAGSNEEDNSSENESKENDNENENENESGINSDTDGAEEGDENEVNENEVDEKEVDENEADEKEVDENEADNEKKEPSESTDSPQAVIEEVSNEAKAKEEIPPVTNEVTNQASTDSLKDESSNANIADDQVTSTEENEVKEPEETQGLEEDDLELAWITLETAKSIFNRQNTIDSQLKVAEILLLLAEISMESDKNLDAIADLQECLKIQKKHLKPDDRIVAETYYQMGLAQLLNKQYLDALENFKTTKKILELRLENLKNTPIDEAAGSFASADKDVEVSDLENILLDIQEKIEDTEELIRDLKKEIEDNFASVAVASPIKEIKEKGETSITVKPVSNITHLLKRKKPEEVTSEGDSKRIKLSSIPNGDSIVTSTENIEKPEGSKV